MREPFTMAREGAGPNKPASAPFELNRVTLVLANDAIRERAIRVIREAPEGARVTFKKPRRTLDQNAKMWAMLTDVARQHPWHGITLEPNDWKLIFLDALDREMRIVPNLAGTGFVSLTQSSSDLGVAEMSDMIELLYAWGADPAHAVIWSESDLWGHLACREAA